MISKNETTCDPMVRPNPAVRGVIEFPLEANAVVAYCMTLPYSYGVWLTKEVSFWKLYRTSG
ncbi:unnamed protein product [Haemonchus placei]|uniref:Uncharacterized protein n=1 Tax=Haemonchus placei TaxID=6290 RepID=A0A3P7ZCT7_HAEPC|nr:unnamed protein product [Haemonchus placei]